jgi:hypothetical protein
MNHIYKQVAPKQPEPLSFVALVKQHGDWWQNHLPSNVGKVHESVVPCYGEFVQMLNMETGLFPRIKHEDLRP